MHQYKNKTIYFLSSFLILILIICVANKVPDKHWKDKNFVTFGDSITWYDGHPFVSGHSEEGKIAKGYQYYMKSKLKCNVINEGMDGKQCQKYGPKKLALMILRMLML